MPKGQSDLILFSVKHLLTFLLIWAHCLPTVAAPTAEAEEKEVAADADYVDISRDIITENVQYLGDKIDSIFGDSRTDDTANESTLRLKQQYFWIDGNTGSFDLEASLNLKLPNLEKREEQLRKTVFPEEKPAPNKKSVKKKKDEKKWLFSQESGVRFSFPLNYFIRARLRREFKLGIFVNYFYEQVGWDSERQWEEKTSLTSDYEIRPHLLFRIINEADWGMTYGLFGTTHGLSLLTDFSEQTAFSVDGRFFTKLEGNRLYEERYSFGTSIRHALNNGWMFLEITPAFFYDRVNNFEGKPGIFASLELAFGGNK